MFSSYCYCFRVLRKFTIPTSIKFLKMVPPTCLKPPRREVWKMTKMTFFRGPPFSGKKSLIFIFFNFSCVFWVVREFTIPTSINFLKMVPPTCLKLPPRFFEKKFKKNSIFNCSTPPHGSSKYFLDLNFESFFKPLYEGVLSR